MDATNEVNELKARILDLQNENKNLNSRVTTLESEEYKRIERSKVSDVLSEAEINNINNKLKNDSEIKIIKYQDGNLELALLNDNLQGLLYAVKSILRDMDSDFGTIYLSETNLSEAIIKVDGLKASVGVFYTMIYETFNKLDVINIDDIIKRYSKTD